MNVTPEQIEGWVERARAGEFAAFERLVSHFERRVYTLALRMTRHTEDAEDVVQETFLSAATNLGRFRGDSSFATWLMRIATNAALKALRKRKGPPPLSYDENAGDDESLLPTVVADWRRNPAELLQSKEVLERIEAALGVLDEGHRLVFLLRDVEGFSVRETAEALGLSESNVKVRLMRARMRLREELTASFGGEPIDPALLGQARRHAL